MRKYARKSIKIILWTIASLLLLSVLLMLIIQIPLVQNIIKDKAVAYLEEKIHTKVSIGNINIGFPKNIILEKVYLESQQKDTLFYGDQLEVNLSLFKLIKSDIEMNTIHLTGITANIKRNKDSVFNFNYIIKAFASKKKDTIKKPTKINIHAVDLDNIHLKFDDAITQNNLKVSLSHFDTQIDKFDLDQLHFDIPKIKLDGFNLKLKQGLQIQQVAQNAKEIGNSIAKENNLKLKLGQIALSKINIQYDNAETQLITGLTLEKSFLQVNTFDLQKQMIELENFDIKSLKGALVIRKSKSKPTQSETINKPAKSWQFKLNQVNLKQIAFRFDDQNAAVVKKGIDYKHLNIQNFNLDGENLTYTSKAIFGNIYAFTVREKSGIDIQSLKTEFYYGNHTAYLKKLYLKTPQSLIKDQIIVRYPSIAAVSKNSGEMNVDATLNQSQIGVKDILIFAPNLANSNPFKNHPNALLKINGKVTGKVNDIHIPHLEISGIGNTSLAASGNIIGLPDTKKAYFDLTIKNFESGAKDANDILPKGTIPSTIQLPARFATHGTFKGTINDFFTNLNVTSSFGNAAVKAHFNQRRKNQESYQANTRFTNFDIGKLLKNKELGKISLSANVNGVGLNPKTATAAINGKVSSAQYQQYTYRNADLKGKITNGAFHATLTMADPNLTFELATEGSFRDKYPAVKLKMNVDIADLEKLNLHAGPLKLKGQIDADFATADPNYLNGNLLLHHIKMTNEKGEFLLDTISMMAKATPEKDSLIIRSQILDADFIGKYKLTTLANAITNSMAHYYDTDPTTKKTPTESQQIAFHVAVKDHPILFELVPGLKSLEPIKISGSYNSVNDTIVLNASIPKLIYNENTISNAVIAINTKDDALLYNLVVDDIQNTQFQLPYTNLSGSIQNNTIDYKLQLKDVKDKERYRIAGNLKSTVASTTVQLSDKLVLNYENWNMNPENFIRFAKNELNINAVSLEKDNNILSIQSESESPNVPIHVDFKDFKIETLTNIIQKDSLVMGGKINGKAVLKNLMNNPLFTADLKIDGFSFRNDTIGNIAIKVDNAVANTYQANIQITGQDNQVVLDGSYNSQLSRFDMDLDLERLHLKSIQGFTMGNLTQGKGFFSGKFKIKGTPQKPQLLGDLQLNDIAFRIKQTNAYYQSMNDKIAVSENGIAFDHFSINDEENNILIVDGSMPTSNFRDFNFNLSVNADNFRALNSKEKDNPLYYGALYLDSRLKIKGDTNQPVVDGTIKVNKGTKLTVVLPQSDPSIVDREGIVEFIDQDHPELNQKLVVNDSIGKSSFKGIDASVNIEIDKEAELSMIIDKSNGDYLKLKGEAQLTGGMDPSGKTTLTGRYEFTGGTYEMTFNLIKRKFDIKEGSYILWTGEPTTADINITAVYKTDAAPIDLLGDQLGNVTPEVRNTYKQKIPFETQLIMKGELLKPDITFDIVLPEGNNSVATEIINGTQTKLTQLRQQPSELNKQVFALLLLNRFIGENPFASEAGGTTAEALARQSASKILSQQLNDIATDLIKGVELNFDLESTDDYTSGQRQNKTDLNVGVSRRLLNDRLKVTVGSTFALEGQQQTNQQANSIAGDLSADYQLSKDGRYRVRAYRKNQYQVALQGQVVETGVAFIITLNYNKFKEVFQKVAKEKLKASDSKKK